MPVIVVGADTPVGKAIINALIEPDREVRAFVTDPAAAENLKRRGVKVALGDVSDPSHVEGAATNCFSAVLVAAAADDERERAFASDTRTVLEGWADAVKGVQRAIWVTADQPPQTKTPEKVTVADDAELGEIAARVAELDSLDSPSFASTTRDS
jgi:uncharacterized protein YbjT (DUF2867 family)